MLVRSRRLSIRSDTSCPIRLTRLRRDRRVVCGGVVAALSVLLAACPGASQEPTEEGLAALRRGDHAAATVLLQAAVENDPGSAEARTYLGMALLGDGQTDEGRRVLRQASSLSPVDPGGRLLLAAGWARLGDDVLQVAALEDAARLDPTSTTIRHRLGVVLARLGHGERALQHLRFAADVENASATQIYDYARALQAVGRRYEALDAYRRVLTRDREHRATYVNLGVLCLELDRATEAVALLRHALELEPSDSLARSNLALAYEAAGDRAGARAEAEQAHQGGGRSPALLYLLGVVRKDVGEIDGATAALAAVLERSPEHVAARRELVALRLAAADVVAAAGLLAGRDADIRSDAGLALLAARVHEQSGDSAAAERAYRVVLERNPVDTEALYGLGQLLLGDAERATEAEQLLARFEAANDASQRREEAQKRAGLDVKRGRELLAKGDARAALAAFRRASSLDPTRVELRLETARLLLALHETEVAVREAEQYVLVRPDDPAGHVTLALASMARSDTAAASRHLLRAVELAPLELNVRNMHAALLLELGDVSAAHAVLQATIALDPTDEEALRLLALGEPER